MTGDVEGVYNRGNPRVIKGPILTYHVDYTKLFSSVAALLFHL